jgi:ribosomal protein S18 acetylase RimI-like enzyme
VLFRLGLRRSITLRVFPAASDQETSDRGLERALYAEILQTAARQGYQQVEFGPVAANDPAAALLEELGARRVRTFRVYHKTF